ncbi:hypothetical protein SCHPADRAFT_937656 [Schizopora paradoxa]|uniref:Uncharacterized protein n=1 Tax=Schizopora paradoxa TaxID=27342 RepID=A0A0H2RYG9_9AGAM|nr:hypothetical protein SCHPADRAFT_937656 [Schizopora paradoxa]
MSVNASTKAMKEYLDSNNYTNIRLSPHSVARNQAVANGDLPAGCTIVDSPALSAVLTFEEKGLRCDTCFRRPARTFKLKKCSGCAEYWYCNEICTFSLSIAFWEVEVLCVPLGSWGRSVLFDSNKNTNEDAEDIPKVMSAIPAGSQQANLLGNPMRSIPMGSGTRIPSAIGIPVGRTTLRGTHNSTR